MNSAMKKRRLITIVAMVLASVPAVAGEERDTLGVGTQVTFVRNDGQWDARVRYAAQLHDAALFLEDDGVTVAVREHIVHPPAPLKGGGGKGGEQQRQCKMHAYKMRFAGGNCVPMGEGQQEGYSNYFIGDEGRWRSRVPSFAAVRYRDLYPGIDLELYTASAALKYNLIVHPGADPSAIAIEYIGTEGVSITKEGDLRIGTTVRDIIEMQPYVYQGNNEIKSRWRVSREGDVYSVSIELGDYDQGRDLVIDPVVRLRFSTYTGSTADNWGTTGTYDSHKNTYTAGIVFNIGYPVTTGAYDATFNGTGNMADIGIFKLDSTGQQRLYATYLGGTQADMPHSLYVNALDELVVLGTTGSGDFPTSSDAYSRNHSGGSDINYENAQEISFPNGSDLFVSCFSADGTRLEASTLIGGTGNDGLNYKRHYNNDYRTIMMGNDSLYYNYGDGARGELITDPFGNVYVGTTTASYDFPTTAGATQRVHSLGQDAVVFKMDHNLHTLLWSTYLGGTGDDAAYSIDLDEEMNPLVCGGTNSRNFPVTSGVLQPIYGGGTADGFVTKLSGTDGSLKASTYVGSDAYDQIYFVRVGKHDETFLFGQTKAGGSTMIENAGYSVPGSGMLLQRVSGDLTERRWSTVFGTPGRVNLSPTAFAADICNRVYAAGWGRDFVGHNGIQWYTAGTMWMETTPDAYCDSTDGQDFYIISISDDASSMDYASFIGEYHTSGDSHYHGTDHVDGGTSRFDRLATLYQSVCASCGGSQGFPTTAGAWCDSNRSANCNNVVFRFNVTDDFPVAEFIPPQAGCAPYSVNFHSTGRGALQWDFGDGSTSTATNPTHTYTTAGSYTVSLVATLPGGCAESDTQSHTVLVLAPGEGIMHPFIDACNGESVTIGLPPTPGATYTWLSSGIDNPGVSNPSVSGSGTYVLRTEAAGCAQTDTFRVSTIKLISGDSIESISCRDSADGRFTVMLNQGVSIDSLTYTSVPTLTISTTDTTIIFNNIAPEVEYNISVSGYGCEYNKTVRLVNKAVPPHTKQLSAPLCNDSCLGSIYIRCLNDTIPETQIIDTLLTDLCPGTYVTTLITYDGCPVTDTSVIVRNHALDSLRVWADDTVIWDGESTTLHASTPTNQTVTYLWSPAGTLDRPYIADPVATPTDSINIYTLTATSGGCSRTETVSVRCREVICGAPLFIIPNAFTPNADGINDAVCFNTVQLSEFSITIFNRWGEAVYRSDDPTRCWDGTYRGTPCPAGVYTYTCHITCFGDHTNDFKGDITLIR